MSGEALAALRCPVCDGSLSGTASGLACGQGHTFDRARQGHVNLTGGSAGHGGDTAAMVAARADFLSRGHFAFIGHALADTASAASDTASAAIDTASDSIDTASAAIDSARRFGTGRGAEPAGAAPGAGRPLVVDVGAGTGYHLARVLDAVPAAVGLALDASKAGVRRAARAHTRALAVVADTWSRLPLGDGTATVLLNVFAPRNGPEFRRVLAPAGSLLVVTPEPAHLVELIGPLGLLRVDTAKQERVSASLGPHFTAGEARSLGSVLELDHAEVRTLVEMGPSARHLDATEIDRRVATLPEPVRVTASVRLSVWLPT